MKEGRKAYICSSQIRAESIKYAQHHQRQILLDKAHDGLLVKREIKSYPCVVGWDREDIFDPVLSRLDVRLMSFAVEASKASTGGKPEPANPQDCCGSRLEAWRGISESCFHMFPQS